MPSVTATTEMAAKASISLKASSPGSASPSSSAHTPGLSTATTLRSLYPRAAKAFLQRDIVLTHSLLSSAFALITPPPPVLSFAPSALTTPAPDPLASPRRKWEILRVTFETTLYAAPPADLDALPAPLRANLMLSPEPFLATVHTRALQLFTPAGTAKPSAACLPAQILVTLALASLKLECTHVGRGMIEDWLARRGQADEGVEDREGYVKVLELYCLHVLPRLDEWDYAVDFLQYERETPYETKEHMLASLRMLREQTFAASSHRASAPLANGNGIPHSATAPAFLSSASSSRSVSPARSATSSDSAGTAKPRKTQIQNGLNGNNPAARRTPASSSASSQSISSAATSRTVTPALVERERSRSTRRTHHPGSHRSARSPSALPRPPRSLPAQAPGEQRPPTTLALIRRSCEALLQNMSRAKLTAYLLFFIFFPLFSLVFRVRRRRARLAGSGPVSVTGGGTVEEVRRRLVVGKEGPGGVVRRAWDELVRAVRDTVMMGGRGLV